MFTEQGIEIDDLTEEGGQKLLVRLTLYGTCHTVKVVRNVLFDGLPAQGIAVILLGIGFACQPFRCRFQSFRNRYDEDRSFRINAACLVSLYGGFVYAETVSELAHGQAQFRPAFSDSFTDLFCGEAVIFCHRLIHLTDVSIAHVVAVCNSNLQLFSYFLFNSLQNKLTRDSILRILYLPSLQNEHYRKEKEDMSVAKIGMTIEEAAEMSGIGRNTMRALVDWGKLPVLKVGRKTIIRTDTLERFMTVNQGRNLRCRDEVKEVV